jgi:4-alpha-glucanotransferase
MRTLGGNSPSDRLFARDLEQLCNEMGLVRDYRDGFGKTVEAPLESVWAVLTALGMSDARHAPREALRAHLHEKTQALVEPITLAWDGAFRTLVCHLRRKSIVPRFRVAVQLEQGGVLRAEARLANTEPHPADDEIRRCTFDVGLTLPLGYHTFHLEGSSGLREGMVIAAPVQLDRPEAREFGLFAPVHALRGRTRQGVGTLAELRELCSWAGQQGASFVGVLPLLATYLDDPYDPSPFAPISKLFWNEALLDLEGLTEQRADPSGAAWTPDHDALHAFDRHDYVDFRKRMKHVEQVAMPATRTWLARGGADAPELRALRAVSPDLDHYAAFRSLVSAHGVPSRWNDEVRALATRGEGASAEGVAFHQYVQLQLEHQLGAISQHTGRGAPTLYMDLPLGAHAESFDAFAFSHCFVRGIEVGAPPDMLAKSGQAWGFSPMCPEGQRRDRYRYFAQTLRTQLRHARMLRIDHVMGLHRVFCVPFGAEARDGLYLRQPHEELYAVLCLEAYRARATCVGEDLGVVPEAVRRAMDHHGVLRMAVLPFEVQAIARDEEDTFSAALATVNTHDMPTFAALWQDDRAARALTELLDLPDDADSSLALDAATTLLGRSAAPFVQLALEDFWGELRPVNVPGVFDPQRSFCRRMTLEVDALDRDPRVRALMRRLRAARTQLVSESRSHASMDASARAPAQQLDGVAE